MLKFVLQKPVWAFCSLALALSSCSTGEVGAGNRPTRFLSVQPIQVCNDFGIFCADLALFEAETKKLWAQADIQVDFLAPVRINGSRFLTIDSQDEFAELSFSGGRGAFGRHPLSTRTSGPINLWFVDRIFDGLVESLGWAWIDQNGVVISDDILGFNNGIGRRDTVAHELGHNLGLTHSNFGAGAPTNLMSDGGVRNIPNSVNDITPDGANLGQLTARQVEQARDSSLVTSSPGPSEPSGEIGFPFPLPFFLDADTAATATYSADAISPLPASPKPPALPNQPIPPTTEFTATDSPLAIQENWGQTAAPSQKTISFSDEQTTAEGDSAAPTPAFSLPVEEVQALTDSSPTAIQVPETEPMVQLAARSNLALNSPSTPSPQPIPNGPAMSLASAGVLALYLRSQRRQSNQRH
jgi:hypothetical protein